MDSTTEPTRRWIETAYQLATLLLLGLLLVSPATAEQQNLVTINLYQTIKMEGSASTATLYLKKIVEQRTDQRVNLLLHLTFPESGSTPNSSAHQIQMVATGTDRQVEKLIQKPALKMQRLASNQDGSYQLLVDSDFWTQLNAELKVILQGAANDTINYISELDEKN
jgi:hypothetical protein